MSRAGGAQHAHVKNTPLIICSGLSEISAPPLFLRSLNDKSVRFRSSGCMTGSDDPDHITGFCPDCFHGRIIMVNSRYLFTGNSKQGEQPGQLLLGHDLVIWDHRMIQHIQSCAHSNSPLITNAFIVVRYLIYEKSARFAAAGPEGFEPPTTWLKARRST